MKFVRAIWKLLVGIKDALVLIFMLLFFGMLYGALVGAAGAGRRRACSPSTSTAALVEQPSRRNGPRSPAAAALAGISPARPRRGARRGQGPTARVKAVALDLDGFTGGGQTAIGDLADAVRRVRAAGKPVVAYATGYTDDSYQLASAASEIWLNPLGARRDRRAGRVEPLLQGPARQARRHRQRLSRRHLQGGGRAAHPQRHVARSARRMRWRSARPSSKAGGRRSSRRGPRPISTCSCRT